TDCGRSLSSNNTDVSGSVDGCVSRGQAWGELSNTWSSDSSYTLVTLGVHGFVRDSLIIGGMVQFDAADDDDTRNISGQGWLAGPYFVSKPAGQNISLEGRLLYGETDNDISPLGSYKDSFDTKRYLAQLRVTGQYSYRTMTLMPLLDFTYTEDMQQAYTDTLGNLLDEQGIDLTQLTFGVDFKLPVAVQTGQLDLTGGLSGTYSETNGGEADFERSRGRVELGLSYSSGNGTTLRIGTFYDGISSDNESYGVDLSFDMEF
ncbi:MAG: autotransporter outer membrane beta-barrel domain-containing protein, partial [Candidatus Azotimanducaceae bacterium WSBS_2022_MAG_OTU7]